MSVVLQVGHRLQAEEGMQIILPGRVWGYPLSAEGFSMMILARCRRGVVSATFSINSDVESSIKKGMYSSPWRAAALYLEFPHRSLYPSILSAAAR